MARALVTGITGQDGSYLAEQLAAEGTEVHAMVRAARHDVGDDFVIATGRRHTVAEFAEAALRRAGVGDGWRDHIEVDPQFLRPMDTAAMVGNAGKARRELGWEPTLDFEGIVSRMVDHDMELLRAGS